MKRNIFLLIFILIFAVGIFFRFYQLGSVPNSLNWDEVSWGYNAYSILLTGKDEHGDTLPLSFRAFGDYKQPMYVYLDTVAVKMFGLTPFAVRFPSALLGSLTIISVYFLTRELFRKQKFEQGIALVAMLLFALSPWSIQFSRVAFEANVALFFVVTGSALFLRGLNTKNTIIILAGIFTLSLSGYTYHSAKVFTPLLVIGMLFAARFLYGLKLRVPILLFGFYILCSSVWILDARTTARGRSVMFTSNQTEILKTSTDQIIHDSKMGDRVGVLLHNRRIVYANTYIENYLSHFDLNYLFTTGDNPRHHPPGMGIIYPILLPFIVIGILYLISKRIYLAWILFYWLLLAPAASALAVDAPNASRSLTFLPTWQIIASAGFFAVFEYLKYKLVRNIVVILVFLGLILNVSYYAYNYFSHTNREFGSYWQYGYEEAIMSVNEHKDKNTKVFFADDVEQAYIFYLFHNKIDPSMYLAEGGSGRIFEKCYTIKNAYFGNCADKIDSGDIIVTTKNNTFNKPVRLLADINDENNLNVVKIYQSQ